LHFLTGKPCPGKTRPHKTRCNAYYKCTELNVDKHVWVPTQCEEGLVYEHSLEVCVLPADDWECGQKDQSEKSTTSSKKNDQGPSHKEADYYVVSNSNDEMDENYINDKYDDGKVEIIIGTGISKEEDDEANENDDLYDGSGNGSEMVELDDMINAENRETNDVVMIKQEEKPQKSPPMDMEKKEELNEVLQTIKTKAEIGQPSSNIDPNLTAHLQRLTQLVDGLKQTYQAHNEKEPTQDLRPDQLNAFLAHFNIKNTIDSLDPNGEHETVTLASIKTSNKTTGVKNETNKNLTPETKVVLTNIIPKRYGSQHGTSNGGGYSNSQIVVNRPEGAVLFALPADHHFGEHAEHYSDNSPKISQETLKTVLELSKQMIASQNMPNVIQNPAYYTPSLVQPILLAQSPFSSDYYAGRPDQHLDHSGGFNSVFSSDYHNRRYKPYEKPAKNSYDNPTTIIHNNVIPLHLSSTGPGSGDKQVLDSYGQKLGLYPPIDVQGERPDILDNVYDHDHDHHQEEYESNKYSTHTTRRPLTTDTPAYGNTVRPFDFHPTSATFNKYFTPSEHLSNHNVNNIFQTTDNYGNLVKKRRPSSASQISSAYHGDASNQDNYGLTQSGSNPGYQHSSPQAIYSEDHIQQHQPQYPDSIDEDESDVITYTYGHKKPVHVDGNLHLQYASDDTAQAVFSTGKNPYMGRPSSMFTSNSYNTLPTSSSSSSASKNKYNRPSTGYSEGSQLVNFGGNFISVDVFQNSILPLLGGNTPAANVEVITCAAGVRQPNTTDCTRYYVCSKKDGKVLSYSCPPYTGFNSATRICDARTYAQCSPDVASNMYPSYSISENKRLQLETLKALQEAKRKQALQQQQAQQVANILQQYSAPIESPGETNMLHSYMQQAASLASIATSTTSRPYVTNSPTKKRKYYCKEGDKIADQTSINSYFVCYKNAQGQMKGHKMTCSKGLLFCPQSTMCTLPSKCS
uniref:Chitin-binding type-2 domain-containing protein n=1 Tax=Stomoxys calcitrans TaxID=35570 RepID=A0A1I8P980_STOCA